MRGYASGEAPVYRLRQGGMTLQQNLPGD